MNTCVGTCLGSVSILPQCAGRELYRGQFLCYGLTRIEYLTSSSLTPSVEVVLFAGFAEYFRLRTGGNLVLRNSDNDDLWATNTGNGFMFLIDNVGYRLINSSYQTIWTGNIDNNFRDGYCVFGNCLGGSATGCPQGRELFQLEFLLTLKLYVFKKDFKPVDPNVELEFRYMVEPKGHTWATSRAHGFHGVYLGDLKRLYKKYKEREILQISLDGKGGDEFVGSNANDTTTDAGTGECPS